jgi:hypothetical protein
MEEALRALKDTYHLDISADIQELRDKIFA